MEAEDGVPYLEMQQSIQELGLRCAPLCAQPEDTSSQALPDNLFQGLRDRCFPSRRVAQSLGMPTHISKDVGRPIIKVV